MEIDSTELKEKGVSHGKARQPLWLGENVTELLQIGRHGLDKAGMGTLKYHLVGFMVADIA